MTSIHTDHLEVLLIIEEWMYKPKPFFLKCFTQPHTENCLKMFRVLSDFDNSLNNYIHDCLIQWLEAYSIPEAYTHKSG